MTKQYFRLSVTPVSEMEYKEFVYIEEATKDVLVDSDQFVLTAAVQKDQKIGAMFEVEEKDLTQTPAYPFVKAIFEQREGFGASEEAVHAALLNYYIVREILEVSSL